LEPELEPPPRESEPPPCLHAPALSGGREHDRRSRPPLVGERDRPERCVGISTSNRLRCRLCTTSSLRRGPGSFARTVRTGSPSLGSSSLSETSPESSALSVPGPPRPLPSGL
jgi:hypothetical protein